MITKIPKFRRCIIQNFPFIEEDFDALTDYELLCKVVEFLNKVINSQNEVIQELDDFETSINSSFDTFTTNITGDFNALSDKFDELKSYVDNYFDNLDVQDEINHKLDDMVEQGTLQEIITTYIQANVAWTFDTVADMKLSENLVNGSYAQTLGFHNVNDGGGALYYITNSGTANEMDVIACDDLFAHLVLPTTVTPETFGAYGDGTHDDTASWNKAVSVHRDVKAFEKTYLTGKITVTDDIDIDCGNASFTCSDTTLFDIKGSVVTNLANENNYARNDADYAIVNTDYSTYSGVAFVHGDNNFQEDRTYYLGGFIAMFKNGKINTSYPISVTNTQIDIINPVKANLKNIKGITHQSNQDTSNSIHITYGQGCKIENITNKQSVCYTAILVEKSLNVNIDNLNISQELQTSDNVTYIVYFKDSSFCNLTNSYLYNRYWHTVTTGGQYLCYKNTIDKCELLASTAPAMSDHRNALGTTITNGTASCLAVSGMSLIDNVIITSCREHAAKKCSIGLMPMSIDDNAVYTVNNVTLIPDDTCTSCGVRLENDVQVTGKTYYYNTIKLSNIRCNSTVKYAQTSKDQSDTTGSTVIKNYYIDNCDLEINGLTRNTEASWDISGCNMYINNINYTIPGSPARKSDIGTSTNDNFNNLYITNCNVRNLKGNCVNLHISNYDGGATIVMVPTGTLTGSNIRRNMQASSILAASQVMITDLLVYGDNKYFNITSNSSKVYYQKIDGGSFVTAELTA